MSDPRWTDEAHALAVAIHDAVCHDRTCPATVIAAVYGTSAMAALDHLRAAGLLVQPGGTVEVQHRYRDPDGFTMIGFRADQAWRLDATRTVTRRPDGSWHFGPWIPTTQEAPHVQS